MKTKKTSAAGSRGQSTGPCENFGAELDRLLATLAPSEDVRGHFRKAGLEVLKGMRSMIDERIQRLSTEPKKGTSIEIS
jgi:hypothetical protein